jgi:lipopolysaccharide transport system ATP-binding protein
MGSISVTNLGKAYKQYPNRWSRLLEWITPGQTKRHELKWVLQGINFTVKAGEAVGIIGINGAGKSTLLKLITGTTQPTSGSVHMSGRVAAMLELGMGFHPDFTGRQNAFMAGQLLGLSSADISCLMPEIEAFSEIGDYIDHPVRVYSSGMQMRLAFSLATAIRPDILIVDEALSVGDTYFQHKSFERIREFRKKGTTLLIVSHDKNAIQGICDRAILLGSGAIAMEGDPVEVMDYYNAMLANHQNQVVTQEVLKDGKLQTISGTGDVVINSVQLLSTEGNELEVADIGESVRLRVVIQALAPVTNLTIGFLIKDRWGQAVFGTNTYHLNFEIKSLTPGHTEEVYFCFDANFGVGSYSITVALHSDDTHIKTNYEWRDLALVFNVINTNKSRSDGVCWLPVSVEGTIF